MSVLPVGVLQHALSDGIDIDTEVKELPLPEAVTVTDASGAKMAFLTAVELPVTDNSSKQAWEVQMFVLLKKHGMIILGTNAMAAIGYHFSKRIEQPEVGKHSMAVVSERVYIPQRKLVWLNSKVQLSSRQR